MKEKKLPRMRIEISADGEDGWTAVTLPYDPDTPFSVVPYCELQRTRIRTQSLEEVRISATVVDRNIGNAFFRYRGRVAKSRVVFPHSDDRWTWGWHAVCYLGWQISPKTGRLGKANLDRKSPPDLTASFDAAGVDVESDLADWHRVRRELRKP